MEIEPKTARKPRAPRWKRLRRASASILAVYVVALLCGCNPSIPFDVVYNAGCAPFDETLRVARDGTPRLVVLQHGLWRSRWALWKLERSLRAEGYEVLNTSYSSTWYTIEEHAATLHDHLEEYLANEATIRARSGGEDLASSKQPELWFVGHSLGGLVIHAYLRRPDARIATGCVFLGTPQRGAVMAATTKGNFWVRLLLLNNAACQLDPADSVHQEPLTNLGDVGTIIGGRGDLEGYSTSIPGDDDGRVGVLEAHLEGETDSVFLPIGHTALTTSNEAILSVLRFLKHRRFGPIDANDAPPPK